LILGFVVVDFCDDDDNDGSFVADTGGGGVDTTFVGVAPDAVDECRFFFFFFLLLLDADCGVDASVLLDSD